MNHHGMTKTRLYRVWHGMKNRCYYEKNGNYKYYGGRGISVCDEWRDDFVLFAIWSLQNGYREDLTIDRIDVNGNYCPENCRWITMEKQQKNKRNSAKLRGGLHYINFEGETHTVTEWANIKGIKVNCLFERMRRGWSLERAMNTPVNTK